MLAVILLITWNNPELRDGDDFHKFLEDHFLHWVEALIILGESSRVVGMPERLLRLGVKTHLAAHMILEHKAYEITRASNITYANSWKTQSSSSITTSQLSSSMFSNYTGRLFRSHLVRVSFERG